MEDCWPLDLCWLFGCDGWRRACRRTKFGQRCRCRTVHEAMTSSSSLTPTNKNRSFMWRLLAEQVLDMEERTRMDLSLPQPSAINFDSDLKRWTHGTGSFQGEIASTSSSCFLPMFNFAKCQSFHVSPEPRPFFAIMAQREVGEGRLQGAFQHD